jgi:hypothetical protein
MRSALGVIIPAIGLPPPNLISRHVCLGLERFYALVVDRLFIANEYRRLSFHKVNVIQGEIISTQTDQHAADPVN